MFTFPFRCPSLTESGSLMTSLAAGGIRNVVRNHGYRSHGISAILAQHRHGLTSLGVRRLSNGGKVSSILCLCGLSVSFFFYLFYFKYFCSRSFYSKYLARATRSILLRRNGGHLVFAFRTKPGTVRPEDSGFGERIDDVNNTTKGPCSRDVEDDLNRGYLLEVPLPPRGPPTRIRRRRTRSESLEAVPERLHEDFARLVPPEVAFHPRCGNVIAWLAKIVVDPTGEEEEEMLDHPVDEEREQELLLLRAGGVSGAGSAGGGRRRWRATDSCSSSDGVLRDSEVESRDSGYGKGPEEESRDAGGSGIEPRTTGLKKRGSLNPRQNHGISTQFDDTMLDSLLEWSDEIRRDNQLDNNNNNNNNRVEKVFYFEKDDDEDDPQLSLLHGRQPRCNTAGQLELHMHGGAGYESMRLRLLGPSTSHRKRTTSTGSRTSGEVFADRGLMRNHYSFNSTTSSGYAYRESLVGKGLSVDGGEDLDRLVLLDADLDRRTLTNIDRLQEDLDNIRRDIGDLNWTVDLLRSRDDDDDDDDGDHLADFSSMYSITGTPTLKFGSRSRSRSSRPRSVSSAPRGCEIQDLIRRLDDWDNFPWDNDDGDDDDDDDDNLEIETGEESDFDDEDRSFWDGQLCRFPLSDCDDEATLSTAVHPLIQYSDAIDDEYIDDGYEVLTQLHR